MALEIAMLLYNLLIMRLIITHKLHKTNMYSEYPTLEQSEQDVFDAKFKEIRYNVHEFGWPQAKVIGDPCIRVKCINKVKVNGVQYKKYAIGFIKYWKFNPYLFEHDVEISHICGNPKNTKQSLCIQGSHMRLELHPENDTRCDCHKHIRKFERSWNRKNNNYNIETKGTLTVENVNQQKRDKLNQTDVECICLHDPVCFINYGKRPRTRRSQRIRRIHKKNRNL